MRWKHPIRGFAIRWGSSLASIIFCAANFLRASYEEERRGIWAFRARASRGGAPETCYELAVVGGCSERVSGNAGPAAAGASQDVPLPPRSILPYRKWLTVIR